MKREDIRQVLLEVVELQLESQLDAIRQLQGKSRAEPARSARPGTRRQSLVDISVQILTERREPTHVNELVVLIEQRFGRITDRDALSSALAKKARRGILFRQSAPATFTLLDPQKEDSL